MAPEIAQKFMYLCLGTLTLGPACHLRPSSGGAVVMDLDA
jgi:hypothetical protein